MAASIANPISFSKTTFNELNVQLQAECNKKGKDIVDVTRQKKLLNVWKNYFNGLEDLKKFSKQPPTDKEKDLINNIFETRPENPRGQNLDRMGKPYVDEKIKYDGNRVPMKVVEKSIGIQLNYINEILLANSEIVKYDKEFIKKLKEKVTALIGLKPASSTLYKIVTNQHTQNLNNLNHLNNSYNNQRGYHQNNYMIKEKDFPELTSTKNTTKTSSSSSNPSTPSNFSTPSNPSNLSNTPSIPAPTTTTSNTPSIPAPTTTSSNNVVFASYMDANNTNSPTSYPSYLDMYKKKKEMQAQRFDTNNPEEEYTNSSSEPLSSNQEYEKGEKESNLLVTGPPYNIIKFLHVSASYKRGDIFPDCPNQYDNNQLVAAMLVENNKYVPMLLPCYHQKNLAPPIPVHDINEVLKKSVLDRIHDKNNIVAVMWIAPNFDVDGGQGHFVPIERNKE